MEKRNLTFDYARALSMLWIVGFWHLQEYITEIKLGSVFFENVTYAVLATFSFMSGFFLGKKYKDPSRFYLDRFKRFWVLFFVSSVFFLLGGWVNDYKSFFALILGLESFFLPSVRTLWYVSMLVFFYALTPFVVYDLGGRCLLSLGKKVVRAFIFFIALYMLSKIIYIDGRLLWNYLFYALGLITPWTAVHWILRKKNICCFVFFPVFYLLNHFGVNCVVAFAFLGMVCLLCMSDVLSALNISWLNKTMTYVAYGSMCAYLFHRQLYKLFRVVLDKGNGIDVMWSPVMICSLVLISYVLQKIYDIALGKVNSVTFRTNS